MRSRSTSEIGESLIMHSQFTPAITVDVVFSPVKRMKIDAPTKAAFWRYGLTAVAIATVASLLVQLVGPRSPIGLVLLPVVFLLVQVPQIVLAYFIGTDGIFRPLFYGPSWLLIPFWAVIVFLWNGTLAAIIANIHVNLTSRE